MEKAEILPRSIKWHFIGGLQSSTSGFSIHACVFELCSSGLNRSVRC